MSHITYNVGLSGPSCNWKWIIQFWATTCENGWRSGSAKQLHECDRLRLLSIKQAWFDMFENPLDLKHLNINYNTYHNFNPYIL